MKSLQFVSPCLVLLAVLAGLAGGGSAAAVVIDEFTTNQAQLTDPAGSPSSVPTGGADIVGQRRGLDPELLAGAGPVSAEVAGGVLIVAVTDTTPDSRGAAIVTWDADADPNVLDADGLTPLDLTAAGHTAFAVTVDASDAGVELVLEVYTDDANMSRAALVLPAVAASTVFRLSYKNDFVARLGSGADFADVGAIVLTVRGTETAIGIDRVETVASSLAATKTDLTLAEAEIGATPQPPGTTYKYRLTITNTGGEALAVDLADMIDADTTLAAATVDATPVAVDDAYEVFGNVARSVTALDGLLANDADPDQNGAAPELVVDVSGSPVTTTLGGTATLAADGAFDYEPPVGVGMAVDTFTYSVTDNEGNAATATAKLHIGRVVWFVDDAHPGADLGTRDDPFVGFTGTNVGGVGGVGDQDGPGDIIFLYAGSHVSGLELEDEQELVGEGDGLILDGEVIVAAGAAATITNAGGSGVQVASGNTVRGLTVGNTLGAGILGTSFGTLTVSNVTVSGTGAALDLTNGNLAAAFNSLSSTNSTGRGVNLDTVTGSLTSGSTSVTDSALAGIRVANGGSTYSFGPTTLSSTASGLELSNNATSTFNFSSLAVTTDAGTGLLASNSGTLNIGGVGNTIVATGGAGVEMIQTSFGAGATFTTVSSSASPGRGINLDTVTGAFSASGGSLSGSNGVAFDVNAGTGAISYGGGITNAANRAVEVTLRTTSSVTLSGNISDSGMGVAIGGNSGGTVTLSGTYNGTAASSQIDIASNSGTAVVNFSGSSKVLSTGAANAIDVTSNGTATVNFTGGGLAITTTSGIGFNATGGAGGVTVQGSGNTITSTTGRALNVVSTTLGAAGLTFRTISSNGAANGIVLSGTGANAGLTVTGTGGDDSGGVIANSSGDGILLSSTRSISLTEMAINNSGQSHIDGTSVNGLTLVGVDTDTSTAAGFLGNGITNLSITGGTFHRGGAGAEPACNVHGFDITNLLGTSSVTGVTITRSNTIQFRVRNTSASAAAPALPADVLTVSGTTWGTHTGPCSGDHLSVVTDTGGNFKLVTASSAGENNFTTGGTAVQVAGSGSGTTHASLTGLDASGNTAGVVVVATATSNVRFNVFDNRTANGTGFSGTGSVALILTCTTSGVCEGAFDNNTINHTAGTSTNAMQVVVEGNGTGRVTVSNNTVSGNFQRGLHGQSRSGTGSLSLLVTGNNITQTDAGGLQVMNLEVGASGGGTTNSLCLNLAMNTATPIGGNSAYRLFHRTGYTYQLQNLVQASTVNTSDVETWVTTTKSNTGTPVSVSIGTSPFTTIAACPTPTLPSP